MKRGLKIFLLADSFFMLAVGMIGPIYAIFVERVGGNILEVGITWSVFMIVSGVGIYLMGLFQDRIKKEKSIIIIGYCLRSAGILGYFFTENVIQLFMVQLLLGISFALSIPAWDSYYTKLLERGKFASQWSAWEALYSITAGVAALVGSFIAYAYGFKALFMAMFIFSLAGLAVSTRLVDADQS